MRRVRGDRDEGGAIALMVALLAVVLFGCAALAVDYAALVLERQKLHDHVDAAAHAGAYELPSNGMRALTAADQMAKANDGTMSPTSELYCVVASTGASRQIAEGQIPATCDPGAFDSSAVRCNTRLCSIPCPASGKCNTVRVSDDKTVPFNFAPVLGRDQGSTGSVSSAACKGSCGETVPNPLDVLIMADRTTSMSDSDRAQMQQAILGSLEVMDPALHYVAFGAMHKSRGGSSCATAATTVSDGVTGGTWIPVPFTDDYLTTGPAPGLNRGSKLVRGVECLPNGAVPGLSTGSYGTHLASAFKGGARYLIGLDPNNISSLPKRPGVAKKVLIFETDGMPDELLDNSSTSTTSLTNAGDVGAGRNSYGNGRGVQGCRNLTRVAEQAKDRGVKVLMIGFGAARSASCEKGGSRPRPPWVRDFLAEAASPTDSGTPSRAETDCSSTVERTNENTDGDYYFCAATGSELSSIFATAINTVTEGIRLVELP